RHRTSPSIWRTGLAEDSRIQTGIHNRMHIRNLVKGPLRTFVVWLSIFTLLTVTKVAEAGPFRDFFRAVSRSIAHPEAKLRSHRSSHKQNNEAPPSDSSNDQTSGGRLPAAPNRRTVNEAPPTDVSNSQASGGSVPVAPN